MDSTFPLSPWYWFRLGGWLNLGRLNYHLIIVDPPNPSLYLWGGLDPPPPRLPGNMSLSAIRATSQSSASSPPCKSKGFYTSYCSVAKNLSASEGDAGSIPGLGRSAGEGNGYPFQYFCLGSPMDKRTWQAAVHGVTKELDTTERLKTTHLL